MSKVIDSPHLHFECSRKECRVNDSKGYEVPSPLKLLKNSFRMEMVASSDTYGVTFKW